MAFGGVSGFACMKKAVAVLFVTAFALMLAGCGPCGFFWDEWRSSKSCSPGPEPVK